MQPVSELLAVKIENCRLKLVNLQQMASQIQAEQSALIEQARAEVQAPVGHLFNTETRCFVAPQGNAVPFSTEAKRQKRRASA